MISRKELASKTLNSQHSLKLQSLSGEQWHEVLRHSADVSDFFVKGKFQFIKSLYFCSSGHYFLSIMMSNVLIKSSQVNFIYCIQPKLTNLPQMALQLVQHWSLSFHKMSIRTGKTPRGLFNRKLKKGEISGKGSIAIDIVSAEQR